ncbi:MAG: recombinase family protein [Hyphomicrobiales bacterium]|nr:recombinase family protein [Hyphomicrobiales bacterium]
MLFRVTANEVTVIAVGYLGRIGGSPTPVKIGYARVSTADQSHDLQLDAMKAAGCGRIVEETASGARADRPELSALLTHMRAGDTLVVWKLDRMSRSLKQLVGKVENLAARDIGFQCLSHDIDTTSASGKLVFGIFPALAEFERELISERTKAGLKVAAARGRKGGRRRKLSATVLAGVRARLAAGEDVARVARDLAVARSTLWRALKR